MSNETKQINSKEPSAQSQPLADDALDQVSGGLGQDGSDLLIVNNGDGSDLSSGGDSPELTGETSDPNAASSDPEWKYVNVRR